MPTLPNRLNKIRKIDKKKKECKESDESDVDEGNVNSTTEEVDLGIQVNKKQTINRKTRSQRLPKLAEDIEVDGVEKKTEKGNKILLRKRNIPIELNSLIGDSTDCETEFTSDNESDFETDNDDEEERFHTPQQKIVKNVNNTPPVYCTIMGSRFHININGTKQTNPEPKKYSFFERYFYKPYQEMLNSNNKTNISNNIVPNLASLDPKKQYSAFSNFQKGSSFFISIEKLLIECEKVSNRIVNVLKQLNDNNINNNNNENELEVFKVIKQPKILKKGIKMKPHQLVGLNWMVLLYKENINGILADEMGLGKTLQSISLLAYLKEEMNDNGPHLIVVPPTTLVNWRREIKMWCSKLSCVVYHGSPTERELQRKDLLKSTNQVNIIITTYNMMVNPSDRGFLRSKFNFSYMILDEAQHIKNSSSRAYKSVKKIPAAHKLFMTGTPIQNNVRELWSFLVLLMPDVFGESAKHLLNELMAMKESNRSAIKRIKTIISPFILRRLKSKVIDELPEKLEFEEWCDMSEQQVMHYQNVRTSYKQTIKSMDEQESKEKKKRKIKLLENDIEIEPTQEININQVDGEGGDAGSDEIIQVSGSKNRLSVVCNLLMELRKATNHPLLLKRGFYNREQVEVISNVLVKNNHFKGYTNEQVNKVLTACNDFELHKLAKRYQLKELVLDKEVFVSTSIKCKKLLEILDKEVEKNQCKVLIFSQMSRVLDVIGEVLEFSGYEYSRMDGNTPIDKRQEIIDDFSESKTSNIFLLSTGVGGVGVNLVMANVVIFYDISFNPQIDRQAEDRAHRISQQKQVRVYRILARDSVDVHIHEMANEKKKLNDTLLSEGQYDDMDPEEQKKLNSKMFIRIFNQILNK
ncbi:SNF2-related domain-containing protein [Tieghemostelium lacteum]|uniref:SNF2-related domain-containing protein n=1 Tax=Tieghemostelium lacteum TaxID=361077 RepID=A0A151Z6L4_TIELA|nr:SNF2-related domain-containing protein [Tieghemostelium lacteum]|eukprot:KYQ89600.1 SNF2-related domain-containing protein [Tieghemostelium lacteum]